MARRLSSSLRPLRAASSEKVLEADALESTHASADRRSGKSLSAELKYAPLVPSNRDFTKAQGRCRAHSNNKRLTTICTRSSSATRTRGSNSHAPSVHNNASLNTSETWEARIPANASGVSLSSWINAAASSASEALEESAPSWETVKPLSFKTSHRRCERKFDAAKTSLPSSK